jgi:hypothetical protein
MVYLSATNIMALMMIVLPGNIDALTRNNTNTLAEESGMLHAAFSMLPCHHSALSGRAWLIEKQLKLKHMLFPASASVTSHQSQTFHNTFPLALTWNYIVLLDKQKKMKD